MGVTIATARDDTSPVPDNPPDPEPTAPEPIVRIPPMCSDSERVAAQIPWQAEGLLTRRRLASRGAKVYLVSESATEAPTNPDSLRDSGAFLMFGEVKI